MDDFFYKYYKQLEDNFNQEVMKHVTDQKVLNDPASVDLMFHSYVDEEKRHNRDAYDSIEKNATMMPDTQTSKQAPEVKSVASITVSKPDLSYRDGPAPSYVKPQTAYADPGTIHDDINRLKAADYSSGFTEDYPDHFFYWFSRKVCGEGTIGM